MPGKKVGRKAIGAWLPIAFVDEFHRYMEKRRQQEVYHQVTVREIVHIALAEYMKNHPAERKESKDEKSPGVDE